MKYSNTIKWLDDNYVSYEIQKDETIHVTSSIDIWGEEEVTLDGVTTTGYIYLNENATLNAPLLTTTTGNIDLDDNATLNAPLLTTAYDIYLRENATLNAPLLDFNADKYKIFDGISSIIQSTKTKNGFTMHSCKTPRFKDCELVGEKLYIATDGKNNAHGKTIKEAIEELTFKNESRDTSKYKNMPLDTVKTPKEWAFIYRVITGACKLGTEMFMNNQELKKKYTLEEILEKTENAFGSEQFNNVIKGQEQ